MQMTHGLRDMQSITVLPISRMFGKDEEGYVIFLSVNTF